MIVMPGSFVYFMDRFVKIDLSFGELVEMFEKDYRAPLKYIKDIVEENIGKIDSISRYSTFIDNDEKIAVIEYFILFDKGEISVKIICADNPKKALMKYYDAEKNGLIDFRIGF